MTEDGHSIQALIDEIVRAVSHGQAPEFSKAGTYVFVSIGTINFEKGRTMTGSTNYTSIVTDSKEVAVAQGTKAKASNSSRGRISTNSLDGADLTMLARELALLRATMRTEATDFDHDEALVAIGQAQKAAEAGDSTAAIDRLKAAGKWALEIAQKLALAVAAKAIETSIGA